jgi:Chlorophyll A-B binding protein
MFKFIAILASIASVVAFAPARAIAKSASLKMSFAGELGAQAPLGFWDPLNILEDADEARFKRLRDVETKHGRIAQLAVLGHIVTAAGIRLPGDIAFGVPFSSMKAGLAALETVPLPGLFQLFHFIGIIELGFYFRKDDIEAAQLKACSEKLGWTEETIAKKQAIELNNGRAAQMGILALMVHEKINNDPYIINSLLGFPVAFNQ